MILDQVNIHNLRNISCSKLRLHPRVNIIQGDNGSGKTSFLEALYILGSGHSFRSRDISSIIQYDKQELIVYGESTDNDTISIKKSKSKPTIVKLNHQYCSSSSELAYLLPIQIFYQDIFQIIDAGASTRRNILNWGMFHVKHEYLSLLKNYKRVLKHRNVLLKSNPSYNDIKLWDLQLSEFSERITSLRECYINHWTEEFKSIQAQLFDVQCQMLFYKGWDRKKQGYSLLEVLKNSFETDRQRQYTQFGPHQADINLFAASHNAKHVLSRGQQKMVLFSLKLAQAKLLDKECLFLFDDLPAELDNYHLSKICEYIYQMNNQVIITTNEKNSEFINHFKESKVFTVEEGNLSINGE